tara:strand:+ start:2618 stop:3118 length:501 start_codon:yes stop_codon:yes gene_type:complete
MARRKVDKTVEHRITFGDLERREFKQSMDAYQRNMNLQAGINGGRAVMYAGVAAGIGAVAYLGVKVYAAIQENSGTIEEYVEELWNKLNGTKTETDPETGETTTVPNTVQSPTGRTFDGNGTGEISNPAAGIPVVGGLFYTGMKIGQISFLGGQRGGAGPFSWLLR